MDETVQEFAFEGMLAPSVPRPEPRFKGHPTYNFIGGHNDPEQIPTERLAQAAARALEKHGRKLAMYNLGEGAQGFTGLREFLCAKLAAKRGIRCTADDILITTGSNQGIDLVNRVLVQPGDTVLIEEFSYAGAIGRARGSGANVVGMPLDSDGIDVERLAAILERLRSSGVTPKYIYTIPTIQNPTGSILPLERRHELIRLAGTFGVPIFEDECYADIVWSHDAPPSLHALAPGRVIHIGSFSKSLAPALRVGYAVADWAILGRMVAMKADGGTGAVDQMVAAEYFGAHFDPHIQGLAAALKRKRDVMIEALHEEFGTSADVWAPEGGIFVWLKLPDQVDVRSLTAAALDAGVAFNPGPDWACDGEAARSYMRLCFALPSAATIREGVAELARVCFEQTGIPSRSGNRLRQPLPSANG
ncbi:aminotransferase-like domain-containing protein [Marinivivus vitaminiproducens]|uniref:aminotransferase-like domain-containing protein n=1 Tax=Marinivivus vitaminiproducens TaxID=3035935 RepID=UPI0027A1A456|nr:PLP-dependent aminotransferase family protein [Geminicoccaceae bacterium SCSIO 64248]